MKLNRLVIEIPEKDKLLVKIHALSKGQTLRQYVLQALALMIVEDEKSGVLK